MWQCIRCKTKNNNNSLNCHGKGCKFTRPEESKIYEKKVFDFCPKCLHNTYWNQAMWHEKYMKANGQIAKRWKKVWKCKECGRLANMIAPPIKTAEEVEKEGY